MESCPCSHPWLPDGGQPRGAAICAPSLWRTGDARQEWTGLGVRGKQQQLTARAAVIHYLHCCSLLVPITKQGCPSSEGERMLLPLGKSLSWKKLSSI